MRNKKGSEYWYFMGLINAFYNLDDSDLIMPSEYLEAYGCGLLDGEANAHPEEYGLL